MRLIDADALKEQIKNIANPYTIIACNAIIDSVPVITELIPWNFVFDKEKMHDAKEYLVAAENSNGEKRIFRLEYREHRECDAPFYYTDDNEKYMKWYPYAWTLFPIPPERSHAIADNTGNETN